jgi:hypothetical protein
MPCGGLVLLNGWAEFPPTPPTAFRGFVFSLAVPIATIFAATMVFASSEIIASGLLKYVAVTEVFIL